eukprot:TRINITY_DN2717_c0_g1_i1.p1 TRINITY_DN2717_c0_g1~~TRINITY_DN2717_c0_g1_i1.p1  ORF type:complete len:122 (+),score=19.29 TRINITY_DN2717_c0_g1_i1:42-407(+)
MSNVVKVVIIGATNSGKTCLIERFITSSYSPHTNTVAGAYFMKSQKVDNVDVVLGIWDTAGSERFAPLAKMFYRNSVAALVCWDMTSEVSFKGMDFWIKELEREAPGCKIFIVGNKCMLVR